MASELNLLFIISMIVVFIVLSGIVLAFLYKQATKEKAYVRTGYGGEMIAQNTGVFIFPFLHHAIPVNLKTIDIEIQLADESAVHTQDYMKTNLSVVFYLRVEAEKQSISKIARTLGDITLSPEKLKAFLSGQLIHAIRKVSAEITMAKIHQQPDFFTEKIQQAITKDLATHSLLVDTVTLKNFDQTAKKFYNEDNAFDAEGLTGLTKIIEAEKQIRHEIEQQSVLQTKQKTLEMEKLLIEMENKKTQLRLDQEREFKIFEAANKLTISQDAIKKATEETQAKIIADEKLEIVKHDSEISLSEKLREKLKHQIETDLIKAEAVKAEVHIKLTRKLEKADNQVKINLLSEQRKNEYEMAKVVTLATARKNAAGEDADALRIRTAGEAERLKILIDTFHSFSKSEFHRDIYPELIELFSTLFLENNQHGFIENPKETVYKIDALLSKDKFEDSHSEKGKAKLKAILDDARNCLTKEALDTINNSELKNNEKPSKQKESSKSLL